MRVRFHPCEVVHAWMPRKCLVCNKPLGPQSLKFSTSTCAVATFIRCSVCVLAQSMSSGCRHWYLLCSDSVPNAHGMSSYSGHVSSFVLIWTTCLPICPTFVVRVRLKGTECTNSRFSQSCCSACSIFRSMYWCCGRITPYSLLGLPIPFVSRCVDTL